ncbi:hypothetical protein FG05_04524 [Fusarium graminearum]|nr:hypothetical protein FG05_04524 [Fusarium graminearum]
MPIVAAETFRQLETFIDQHNQEADDSAARIIQLAFFASQHKDVRRDPNASPHELAMSLLLQLVDHYRYFKTDALSLVENEVDPEDIDAILYIFESLLIRLSRNTILLVIIDDLKAFAQPSSRMRGMRQVIETLLVIHHEGKYKAKVKFIFGNSSRNNFSHGLFAEDETLRIWQADATLSMS